MKKYILKSESERRGVSDEKNYEYASKLSEMINCKTVWTASNENEREFANFYLLIDRLFPNLTAKARKLTFGGGCFVYVIEGKNATKN